MRSAIRKLLTPAARRYLADCGVLPLLVSGDATEISADPLDLANLHKAVRKLRPNNLLEFGIGFSTIVLAHAVKLNGSGKVYSVDADDRWISNLKRKLPTELAPLVEIIHSPVSVATQNNELCSLYELLPDIVPDFIYLDGPSPTDVKGSVRGLSFQPANGQIRQPVAADILLYESTLKTGATIVVDSRYMNVHFLRRNLRRSWRVKVDRLRRQSTFTLLEHTGRQ